MRRACFVIAIAAVVTGGCISPEATRTRGNGPGADVGNRPEIVRMHDGSDPFWKTPDRIDSEHPSLEPAHHARQFTRQ